MSPMDALNRDDCPVKPLGIDADGKYIFLNDKRELVTLSAEDLGSDDWLTVLFTTSESRKWATRHFLSKHFHLMRCVPCYQSVF
jgi:hypothetical protein